MLCQAAGLPDKQVMMNRVTPLCQQGGFVPVKFVGVSVAGVAPCGILSMLL